MALLILPGVASSNERIQRTATKTVTLDGTAGNGAVGTVAVFTVVGQVLIETLTPFCTEDLLSAGAGTMTLGIPLNPQLFIALTTATNLDNNEWWFSGTPTSGGAAVTAALKQIAITGSINITVATGDITDGTIRFEVAWRPLSSNGDLVAA